MPTCQTKFHGSLTFEAEQILRIPDGLFGFPDEKEFLLLELPSARPLVFVQSIQTANLCFLAFPAQVVEPSYQLSLSLLEGEVDAGADLKLGNDLLCLALLTVKERQVTTANLKAPILIDVLSHQGRQVIVDQDYSHYHPVPTEQRYQQHAH